MGILVTITRVHAAANLFEAKVFVSAMPENKIDEVLLVLKKNVYHLQQLVNRRLRMRPVPQIIFVAEKTTKEAARIEELLEELKKKER